MFELLNAIPIAAIGAIASWIGAMVVYRDRKKKEQNETGERLEIHRDDLMLELLQAARGEISVANQEMKTLRDEVKTLRAIEKHFYHFQQSLDHLEAVLFAESPEARALAERSAKAFLNRMRRLTEARGVGRNEQQIEISEDRVNPTGEN